MQKLSYQASVSSPCSTSTLIPVLAISSGFVITLSPSFNPDDITAPAAISSDDCISTLLALFALYT